MALGWSWFTDNSFMADYILRMIADSIFLIPTLGFCFLLYLIIKDVWFD